MKSSAAYPKEFAEAVCKKHLDFAVLTPGSCVCMQFVSVLFSQTQYIPNCSQASDEFCGPQHAADEEIPSIHDFLELWMGSEIIIIM